MDCNGHGTHVAGILAAQPNDLGFTGVAPQVTLGAYRVFGCTGSSGNDILIAAFNQAYQDGANIITSSIGGASGWPEDPWAATVSRIVAAGVPCTVAAGNDGTDGQFYASGAADGKHVTAITSYDSTIMPDLLYMGNYTVDDGDDQVFGWDNTTVDAWDGVQLPLYVLSHTTTTTNDGCDAFPSDTPDLSGFIVLIRRGTCNFSQKMNNAAAFGAQYVLIYNNAPGTIQMIFAGLSSSILGAAMVTADQGASWVSSTDAGSNVTLAFVGSSKAPRAVVNLPNTATPGAISYFVSWGPTWEMNLKPQFGAPGGSILSTYPVNLGSYAVLSGTSMATPHAAGIYALLSQALGTYNPQAIEDVLATTANPYFYNSGGSTPNNLAPVQQQGGGLVQAYKAATLKSQLHPSGISFNDTAHHLKSASIKIVNNNSKTVVYTLGSASAVTCYTLGSGGSIYPEGFQNDLVTQSATVSFNRLNKALTKVTVAAGKSLVVNVTTTDPANVDTTRLPVWSGWITVNGTDGSALSIPYQGLAGSLNAATVLGPGDAYLTSLSAANAAAAGTRPTSTPDGTVFTLPAPGNTPPAGQDYPVVQSYLALGSSQIAVYAVPAAKPQRPIVFDGHQTIGQLNGFPYFYADRGNLQASWDGSLNTGAYVPAGNYTIVVAALKLYGHPKNASDWNTVQTQSVIIKYA